MYKVVAEFVDTPSQYTDGLDWGGVVYDDYLTAVEEFYRRVNVRPVANTVLSLYDDETLLLRKRWNKQTMKWV